MEPRRWRQRWGAAADTHEASKLRSPTSCCAACSLLSPGWGTPAARGVTSLPLNSEQKAALSGGASRSRPHLDAAALPPAEPLSVFRIMNHSLSVVVYNVAAKNIRNARWCQDQLSSCGTRGVFELRLLQTDLVLFLLSQGPRPASRH